MLLVIVMTILQLSVNVILPSQLNDNWSTGIKDRFAAGVERWEYEVNVHKTLSAFASRIFTTSILDFFKETLGIPYVVAYTMISALAYLLCGIVIVKISKHLKFSPGATALSVSLFYLNFANLFHQMRPIYTYDDPFQILFILLGTYAVLRKNVFVLLVSSFLASYVRESSVFIFPAWICLTWFRERSLKWTGAVFATLFISGIFYLIANHYTQIATGVLEANKEYMKNSRLAHFKVNFGSLSMGIVSILSAVNMLLFPIGITVIHRKELFSRQKSWVYPFLIVLLINTPIIIGVTLARESRLFILPLIFMWPLFGPLLLSWLREIGSNKAVKTTFLIGCASYSLFVAAAILFKGLNIYARPLHIMAVMFFLLSNVIYTRANGEFQIENSSL